MNFVFKPRQVILFQKRTEEGQEPERIALVYEENKWARSPLTTFTADDGVPQGDDVLETEFWKWLNIQIQIPGIEISQFENNTSAFELKAKP